MVMLLEGFHNFITLCILCVPYVWEQEHRGTAAALKMTFHLEQKVSTEKTNNTSKDCRFLLIVNNFPSFILSDATN